MAYAEVLSIAVIWAHRHGDVSLKWNVFAGQNEWNGIL